MVWPRLARPVGRMKPLNCVMAVRHWRAEMCKKALRNIHTLIAPALADIDIYDQQQIDRILTELDGSGTFSRLGGNAAVACSMAAINTAAADAGLPLWKYLAGDQTVALPLPQIQIFGGGAHAGRRIDIQI